MAAQTEFRGMGQQARARGPITGPETRNPAVGAAGSKQNGTAIMIANDDSLGKAIQAGRQLITPALARRILDEANYDRQRSIYQSSLEKAKNLVLSDDWVDGHQIWFGRLNDGTGTRIHLIDGQHRLSAIWATGVPRVFQVEIVDAPTLDGVHELYTKFNRFGRPRTNAEMLAALNIPGELGIGKLTAGAAFKAVSFIAADFDSGRFGSTGPLPTDRQKTDAVRHYSPLIQKYDQLITGAEVDLARLLRNPGVMALAMVTLRDQPEMASRFWAGVAGNDGLRKGDPRHTLIATFRTRRFTGGDGMSWVTVASHAWNAFFAGKHIGYLKLIEGAVLKISGVRRGSK